MPKLSNFMRRATAPCFLVDIYGSSAEDKRDNSRRKTLGSSSSGVISAVRKDYLIYDRHRIKQPSVTQMVSDLLL